MDAGRIDRVDGADTGHDGGNHRTRDVVNDLAKAGVLLRGPADDGERPDGTGPVKDGLHVQHGEVMLEAVIAEMVAERPLRKLAQGIDGADNAEVGVGED